MFATVTLEVGGFCLEGSLLSPCLRFLFFGLWQPLFLVLFVFGASLLGVILAFFVVRCALQGKALIIFVV